MSAPSESKGTSPADFLRAIEGKTVLVKLNSGVDYRGAFTGRFMGVSRAKTKRITRELARIDRGRRVVAVVSRALTRRSTSRSQACWRVWMDT